MKTIRCSLVFFALALLSPSLVQANETRVARDRQPELELGLSIANPSTVHGILQNKQNAGLGFYFLGGSSWHREGSCYGRSGGLLFNYDFFRATDSASPTSPFDRGTEIIVAKPDLGIYLSFGETEKWKPLGFALTYSVASLSQSDKNLVEWGFSGFSYLARYFFAEHWNAIFFSSYYLNVARSNSLDTYTGFWLNRLGVGYSF